MRAEDHEPVGSSRRVIAGSAPSAGAIHALLRNDAGSSDKPRCRNMPHTTMPIGASPHTITAIWSMCAPAAVEVNSGSENSARSNK